MVRYMYNVLASRIRLKITGVADGHHARESQIHPITEIYQLQHTQTCDSIGRTYVVVFVLTLSVVAPSYVPLVARPKV